MKKVISVCMIALTAIAMMTGCGNAEQEKPSTGVAGKIVVNIEGTVDSVNENGVVLENGQVVIFNTNTIFTDVNGTVENPELTEGDYIQGYTEDDATAAEVTAKRVHIVQ